MRAQRVRSCDIQGWRAKTKEQRKKASGDPSANRLRGGGISRSALPTRGGRVLSRILLGREVGSIEKTAFSCRNPVFYFYHASLGCRTIGCFRQGHYIGALPTRRKVHPASDNGRHKRRSGCSIRNSCLDLFSYLPAMDPGIFNAYSSSPIGSQHPTVAKDRQPPLGLPRDTSGRGERNQDPMPAW